MLHLWYQFLRTMKHINDYYTELCEVDICGSLIFKASYVSSCSRPILYRTEKDKAPPSPYLTINNNGDVEVQNDQVLVSTCRMHIYKFPFDVQSCNLSFKSAIHSGESVSRSQNGAST